MTVHYETDGPVAIVTLDRPDVSNAIDRPTADELVAALRRFDADDSLPVAVLTGANGTFCAGADLKAMREDGAPRAHELAEPPQAALRSDRLSSYEQWSLALDEALGVEYRHGMATLETGEMFAGLDDYASGGWRTGAT